MLWESCFECTAHGESPILHVPGCSHEAERSSVVTITSSEWESLHIKTREYDGTVTVTEVTMPRMDA